MKLFIAALFFLLSLSARADVRLPAIIGSHMVLQQNAEVTLWGWAEPGESIRIKPGWDTATYTTKGTFAANWKLTLRTPKASGPYAISIRGNNAIDLEDVLIGEVWLCSGQSNMEWSVTWGLPYEKEVAGATNRSIRFFHIPRTSARTPQDDVKARWVVCTPDEMKKFSAAGYFFGQELNERLGLPVGLIGSSWGGTPAEVWTPDSVVNSQPMLKEAAQKLNPADWWPISPGATYNAMIHPLKNFTIAGALWYQGESNTGTWRTYQPLLTGMIEAWRTDWGKPFPFYVVQIAPYAGYGAYPSSALLREQQTKIATHPNTAMIVVHDLVDNINDIHPKLKKEVGQRLAHLALTKTYGLAGLAWQYPQYEGMTADGNKIRIRFKGAEKGLLVKGKDLRDFVIAGEDRVFYPARAILRGNEVIVSAKEVNKPVAVRFGYSNTAMPNLFSREGLPVNIFRTDNWEVQAVPATK